MSSRPVSAAGVVGVVADALDPSATAGFWAGLLGWEEGATEGFGDAVDDAVSVRAPESDGCPLRLVFTKVSTPKEVKNRIHLDLASDSRESQRSTVDHALELGAREVDIGQGPVPWTVLADPEGNEFCVLEPRAEYAGCGAVAAVVADAHDPAVLAAFWSEASGWPVSRRHPRIVSLRSPEGRGPWLEFLRVDEPRSGGDRLRFEAAGDATRLLSAGARPADREGPATHTYGVFLDPEGNEFVLRAS